MRWFRDVIQGIPAEFESRFGLEESVARLSAATRRFILFPMRQVAVGRVSQESVSLRKATPFVENSFAPQFFGAFYEHDGRTVLFGHFTIHWAVKAFMTLWLSGCLLWTSVVVLTAVAKRDPVMALASLAGVAMLGLGVGFVWFCSWRARGDIPWLSAVIRDALSG